MLTDFEKIVVEMFIFGNPFCLLIDLLRKLVNTLHRFRCFQRACGLHEVSHLLHSLTLRSGSTNKSFQGFKSTYPRMVLIDSIALQSSLRFTSEVRDCRLDTNGSEDISFIFILLGIILLYTSTTIN